MNEILATRQEYGNAKKVRLYVIRGLNKTEIVSKSIQSTFLAGKRSNKNIINVNLKSSHRVS
jgi:hypothetical protein